MTPEDDKNYQRYMAALHAVQSAVALEISIEGTGELASAGPKHLRTGVNACLVDNRAIVALLIRKGLFSDSEYFAEIAVSAEEEQARYTERLREKTGNQKLSFG